MPTTKKIILQVYIYGEEGHFSQIIMMWSTEMKEKRNEIMKPSSLVRTQPRAKTYAESLPSNTPCCLHGFSKWKLLLVTGEVTWWNMCHCWSNPSRTYFSCNSESSHYTDTNIYNTEIFLLPDKDQGGQNIEDHVCTQHNWGDQTSSIQIIQSAVECQGR